MSSSSLVPIATSVHQARWRDERPVVCGLVCLPMAVSAAYHVGSGLACLPLTFLVPRVLRRDCHGASDADGPARQCSVDAQSSEAERSCMVAAGVAVSLLGVDVCRKD